MHEAPLKGIKVLDMGWVMVGPMSGRYLADLGADVVKVESRQRIDPLRTLGPFKDGVAGPERTLSYHFINAGKRSLALDLSRQAAREIVRTLAGDSDVLIESFTPGVMARMGLDYPRLRETNPRLVMASTCIMGQTGPAANTSGVGTLGAAYAGMSNLMGWPDRPPTGPYGAWTDSVAPRFVVAAILAALHRRRHTGLGCHIDVAQAEAGLQFVLPAWFDYAANGHVAARRGGVPDPLRAPCGVYPCAGEDRWVAIDAADPAHWRALARCLGAPVDGPAFATVTARLRRRAALDEAISAWTRLRTDIEAEATLQAAGVPAHAVSHANDLDADADLAADGYFQQVEAPVIGPCRIRGAQFRIAPAATEPARPGPCIGDGTDTVLRERCGLSEARIAELRADGVLQ
ncbi:CoA transferase [Verticiella sediminum]|uniref:CoA transferase n=1 Tax=Verticiella sediminum TaxID=1247510 RepID=A0A556B258_9BURK|nr:CoA transferase [Verticiella sediminum]TSH99240.1 CoA transferase [Verticiella sediminum]